MSALHGFAGSRYRAVLPPPSDKHPPLRGVRPRVDAQFRRVRAPADGARVSEVSEYGDPIRRTIRVWRQLLPLRRLRAPHRRWPPSIVSACAGDAVDKKHRILLR